MIPIAGLVSRIAKLSLYNAQDTLPWESRPLGAGEGPERSPLRRDAGECLTGLKPIYVYRSA
jgi:hypothetical protein